MFEVFTYAWNNVSFFGGLSWIPAFAGMTQRGAGMTQRGAGMTPLDARMGLIVQCSLQEIE